jgi:hypothetical protein
MENAYLRLNNNHSLLWIEWCSFVKLVPGYYILMSFDFPFVRLLLPLLTVGINLKDCGIGKKGDMYGTKQSFNSMIKYKFNLCSV